MEELLHYCWKHRLFPLNGLATTDGKVVEVIDPGLHNHNSGPDFFNAKVRIGSEMWVGNVELHLASGDWYVHGHDRDAAYDNVILHVCQHIDREIATSKGRPVPQMALQIPATVSQNYAHLLSEDRYPRCHHIIKDLPRLTVHAWMSALQTERLEQKTEAIERRADLCDGNWESAFFVTLARNYGFGINGDAFEQWAFNVSLENVAHHRDDLFQTEAIFLGQAGLLELSAIPDRHQEEALREGYFTLLRNEYLYLSHKFGLHPIDATVWRFLRLRPQNFPHIRISQLAQLYYDQKANLSRLAECQTVDQLRALLTTHATDYWQTHYAFGAESAKAAKQLSKASVELLIINTAIPMLFAYGRHLGKTELQERAFSFLEQIKAERNHIIRIWQECGLQVANAGDSQALIQLKNHYCDRKDCLRCRFGYEYLKTPQTPPINGLYL